MSAAIQSEIRCPECNALTGHCITCSRQTVEEKAAQATRYYDAWVRDCAHYLALLERQRKQITFWQGKHAMLKRENNALRKKLTPPREARKPAA